MDTRGYRRTVSLASQSVRKHGHGTIQPPITGDHEWNTGTGLVCQRPRSLRRTADKTKLQAGRYGGNHPGAARYIDLIDACPGMAGSNASGRGDVIDQRDADECPCTEQVLASCSLTE